MHNMRINERVETMINEVPTQSNHVCDGQREVNSINTPGLWPAPSQQLDSYIDAMVDKTQLKSMRTYIRAMVELKSTQSTWLGNN